MHHHVRHHPDRRRRDRVGGRVRFARRGRIRCWRWNSPARPRPRQLARHTRIIRRAVLPSAPPTSPWSAGVRADRTTSNSGRPPPTHRVRLPRHRPAGGEVVTGVLAWPAGTVATWTGSTRRLAARTPRFRFDNGSRCCLGASRRFLYVRSTSGPTSTPARSLGDEIQADEADHPLAIGTVGFHSGDDPEGGLPGRRLVLTAGPWPAGCSPSRGARLRVMRQTMLWFGTADDAAFRGTGSRSSSPRCPAGPVLRASVIDGRGVEVARRYQAPGLRSRTKSSA